MNVFKKIKINGLIAAISMLVLTIMANSACAFYAYQDKLPEEAKKLRKF